MKVLNLLVGRSSVDKPSFLDSIWSVLPIVMADQIYSFDRDTLMKSIPRAKGVNEDQFRKTTEALFNYIIQIADNTGVEMSFKAANYASHAG
jgi:hypothetical protein